MRSTAIALLAVSVAGCASGASPHEPTTGVAGGPGENGVGAVGSGGLSSPTGSVGLSLLIGPQVTLTMCQWSIANGTNYYAGFVNLGDSPISGPISFVEPAIQNGTGYVLTVSATDSNGDPCSGTSSPFSVTAGIVNSVMLQITCVAPTDAAIPTDVVPVECEGCDAAPYE
jgi:hypothetical protein